MATVKSIDLFAGIGGIRLGFEKAFGDAIETVFVSELDEWAAGSYRANFGVEPIIQGDITRIDGKDVPDFDICMAGFPCQAFSIAGKRMGFEDDYKGVCRGTLFFDVARICSEHRPKVIFCENVKGLVNHDGGRTFEIIKSTLNCMGYNVYWQVLNSRDFGVPQNRERVYIVAIRKDADNGSFRFPEPADGGARLADIVEKEAVSAKYYLSDVYLESLKRHRARHEALGHGFGYEIRDLDGIANTLVCGGMGRERNLIVDDRLTDFTPVTRIKGTINREGIRRLTPRECARLQGFPDDYNIDIWASDTRVYKQIANSVTVPVITAIATEIRRSVFPECALNTTHRTVQE